MQACFRLYEVSGLGVFWSIALLFIFYEALTLRKVVFFVSWQFIIICTSSPNLKLLIKINKLSRNIKIPGLLWHRSSYSICHIHQHMPSNVHSAIEPIYFTMTWFIESLWPASSTGFSQIIQTQSWQII